MTLSGSSESTAPWLTLRYDPHHADEIFVDDYPLPVVPGENKDLDLNLYVDGSVIEVFINGEAAYTKRFYCPENTAPDLQMQWAGRLADIANLRVWQLSPISIDRLTT